MRRATKQTLAAAALTATLATIGMNSLMPSTNSTSSGARQQELAKQYSEVHKARERERRRLLRLQTDAQIRENLRPAEVHQAKARIAELTAREAALRAQGAAGDDAARAAARRVLRRP